MKDARRLTNMQLREIVYVDESGIHGRGVFASRRIAEGEYIGTFAGPEARRDGIYVLWVYAEDGEDRAIGRSGRNLLRYLNHDGQGNAEFDGFDLYARCVIPRDEEITIDYGNAE